jgi:NAD(P)-dependent dehydrogenase (short-subunit alcohol dehydrogenase family)
MTGRLGGMTALVTGGASGIGRAVVRRYHQEGASVTVLDRSAAGCAALVAELPGVRAVTGDATDPLVVEEAIRLAESSGPPLGQLTCCVGIHDQYALPWAMEAGDLSAGFTEIFAVNVLSAVLAVSRAVPSLSRARGSITLTLSESAHAAVGGGPLYGASKWAVRGLLVHLASRLAPKIRVNGVSPGGTSGTNLAGVSSWQHPAACEPGDRDARIAAGNALGVVVTPEELAEWFVMLADPIAARSVTGVTMHVDGGWRTDIPVRNSKGW